jgi:hypothetical protein
MLNDVFKDYSSIKQNVEKLCSSVNAIGDQPHNLMHINAMVLAIQVNWLLLAPKGSISKTEAFASFPRDVQERTGWEDIVALNHSHAKMCEHCLDFTVAM